ncbi:glycosyltransferase [Planosporangium thailandense]|uniref:Glycosyltransferase n=1 Tax=Planosporangium thailandense TaxID=765197 RepID=A0ABX0Y7G3_9ACTN|nr:glycosyltransferase [Planosporangium thailandense]
MTVVPEPAGTGAPGRPLRVVLAVGTLRVGGTETQLVKLAVGLRERGHDVHVLALSKGGPLEEPLRAAGVDVRVFGYAGMPLSGAPGYRKVRMVAAGLRELLAVGRHLRALRPDVCHAFLFTGYSLVLPLARAAGVPVRVAGRRGATPPPVGRRNRLFHALGRGAATAMVCNWRAGAEEAVQRDGYPTDRVRVIPNGVDLPGAHADVTRQPAHGVMIANLIAYKGHDDLLAALASLPAPPRVRLIGDGPQRAHLDQLCRGYGLDDVVEFAGGLRGASRYLPEHQFAVLASHEEGLPNAVLEAMAAGLPVVATTVGGVPELITDGETGLLVPPHAPTELAAAIARLAGDPALRARLGAAAREAATAYSTPACVERHEALYRDLLG